MKLLREYQKSKIRAIRQFSTGGNVSTEEGRIPALLLDKISVRYQETMEQIMQQCESHLKMLADLNIFVPILLLLKPVTMELEIAYPLILSVKGTYYVPLTWVSSG